MIIRLIQSAARQFGRLTAAKPKTKSKAAAPTPPVKTEIKPNKTLNKTFKRPTPNYSNSDESPARRANLIAKNPKVFPDHGVETDQVTESYVYLIQAKPNEPIYKIGYTKQTPEKRKSYDPSKIEMYNAQVISSAMFKSGAAAYQHEQNLHRRFQRQRSFEYDGLEWFNLSDDEVKELSLNFKTITNNYQDWKRKSNRRKF
jgi:hypothetical protein